MGLLGLLQGMAPEKEEKQLPLPKDGEPGGRGEAWGVVESAARPRAAPGRTEWPCSAGWLREGDANVWGGQE